jgi:hypothetical protein
MAAALTVVHTAPCHQYALALAPVVHHKLHSLVVALVRIHTHNSAVLEEVEVVCCSRFVVDPEKDECMMSSSQCHK